MTNRHFVVIFSQGQTGGGFLPDELSGLPPGDMMLG
jgi:hypothetical protein